MIALPFIVQGIIITAAGLIGGSFASAIAHRVPQGLSWAGRERSRCAHCDAVLTARDLVPLLSWLLLRGRCRHCGGRIAVTYPLMELSAAAMAWGLFLSWGWGMALPFMVAAVPFLLAHIVIDARHMILPDVINIILAVIFAAWIATSALWPVFDPAALGWGLAAGAVYPALIALVGMVMSAVLKKDALGGGDVKFFAVAGLGLGFMYLPLFLMLSGVFGVLCGLWWRLRYQKSLFPFGPALIAAFYVTLLARGAGFDMFAGG